MLMAPKTSLFPPNRQKIKRAEEARKNQIKTMGDLEFTADMQPQFVGQMTQEQKDFIGGENPEKSKFREIFTYLDDPIAQYGFDPDRIRLQEPDKYQIQNVWSSKQPTTTDANAEYNPGYTKTGPNRLDIEKDIIKYGVKLGSSKEIIAHEARHRGFQLLRDMQLEGSEEDQKAWIEKYGREAAGLLDIYFSRNPRHKFSAETINEIRDRPDAKFNPPKFDAEGNPPNMGLFREGDRNAAIQFVPTEDLRGSKKSGRIQFSGDFTDLGGNLRASLSNEFINKAFQGLDKAAKDAMKKQKDDYRNKMTVRSQEGKRKFAQGGVAMKDQMEMSFGQAETVDPVSGNDVPPGSLPEEVRDDIPARLSEGEYVVPADVVRYYGVKFFEDLRTQAKMGLTQMDADGRIGGEPMEPQQAELSDDDLNSIIEQAMQQEQPMMANEGGVVGYKHGGYHPPDFLGMSVFGDTTKTDDTSANQFYDVSDYKPTTGDYGTPEAAAPTVTANVPDPVCPPGPNGERQRYDKSKGMCVPVSEGPTTEPEDPTPSTPFGEDFNDGKGVNWNNPKDVLKFANTFNTGMISEDVRTGAGLATAFIPGAAPIAALGALGGKIDATKDVAGLKASRMIAAALGQTENVNQIGGILKDYEKKFGDGFSGTFGIGTGLNYAASALGVERKDMKEFMEVYDSEGKNAKEKLAAKEKLQKLINTSRDTERQRAFEKAEYDRKVAEAQARQASIDAQRRQAAIEAENRRQRGDDGPDFRSGDEGGGGSSNFGTFTGRQTGRGSGPTSSGLGGTGRGRSAYQEGGLVQRRKKK
jgi:hypothetical protein